MDRKLLFLAEMLLLISLCSHKVGAQSNGDLRLIEPKQPGSYRNPKGRLEIYLNGTWGTFCANQFDSTAADIACRQMGYLEGFIVSNATDNHDFQIPLATNSTPIHVGSTSCCELNDNTGYILHILRCNVDLTVIPPTCTHDNDVLLVCSFLKFVEYSETYDTQLFLNAQVLNSTYSSSGVLEIYSKDFPLWIWGWSNICGTKFDQNAANAACRQLGYTGATSYSTNATRSKDNKIWLDEVTCGDSFFYSCLDSCFCYPLSLTADQCNTGNVVALTCTFDLADADDYAFQGLSCEVEQKHYCSPDTTSPDISVTTQSSTCVIILSTALPGVIVISAVMIAVLLVVNYRQRQRQYLNID